MFKNISKKYFKRRTNNLKYKIKSILSNYQVIGYPKSGNTWLRFFIINYAHLINNDTPINKNLFSEYKIHFRSIPNIIFSHGTKDRRIKPISFENLDPFINFKRKTIFLSRDPRDVLISSYFHEKYREGESGYPKEIWTQIFPNEDSDNEKKELSDFIKNKIRGIESIVNYMNFIFSIKNQFSELLFVKYEDLHNNPIETFKKIVGFFNLSLNKDVLNKSIEHSSFSRMRDFERNHNYYQADLGTPNIKDDERSYKCRSGKIGEYKKYLKQEDIDYIDYIIYHKLDKYYSY